MLEVLYKVTLAVRGMVSWWCIHYVTLYVVGDIECLNGGGIDVSYNIKSGSSSPLMLRGRILKMALIF